MSDGLRTSTKNLARPRAWIALAIGDGASPYDDESGASYQYDSKVQNHKQVQEGDILFVRSSTGLQGAGRIRRIEIGSDRKQIARCPECKRSIGARRARIGGGQYHCRGGHVFSTPMLDTIEVKTFRAHFDGDWIAAERPISAIELRRFALSKSMLLSIMPADRNEIVAFVGAWSSAAFRDHLRAWAGGLESLADDEANDEPDLTPEGEDRRPAALRLIRLRRGQRDFRDALIDRYDGRCAISGCSVLGVLEAAHLRTYRGPGDNHASNGVLLRSDLHTLFDLDLLGIDPATCAVTLSKSLRGSEYEKFDRVTLAFAKEKPPDNDALQQRWNLFLSSNSLAVE
jgi:hypothetical protein